jgi:hypothetical protein
MGEKNVAMPMIPDQNSIAGPLLYPNVPILGLRLYVTQQSEKKCSTLTLSRVRGKLIGEKDLLLTGERY